MRKILAFCVLVAMVSATSGCLVQDRDHNRQHYMGMRQDLHMMHRDVDRLFKWDGPSSLVDTELPED